MSSQSNSQSNSQFNYVSSRQSNIPDDKTLALERIADGISEL